MLAKIVSYGETRQDALRTLIYGLKSSFVQGITTNHAFLVRCLENKNFQQGKYTTDFITKEKTDISEENDKDDFKMAIFLAALYLRVMRRKKNKKSWKFVPPNWSNVRKPISKMMLARGEERKDLFYHVFLYSFYPPK